MRKEILYCNLCGDHKEREELFAFYWDSTAKNKDKFGAYTLVSDVTKCDKHICTNCVIAIKEEKF